MNIAPFASKASYCSKDALQKCKSELCSNVSHDRCIWLPAFFSYFFSQPFVDLDAFWWHPCICCEDKGIECGDFSMSIILSLYISFFRVVCRSAKATYIKIRVWGTMCDPVVSTTTGWNCSLSLCCYDTCLSCTVFVLAPSTSVHNCCPILDL